MRDGVVRFQQVSRGPKEVFPMARPNNITPPNQLLATQCAQCPEKSPITTVVPFYVEDKGRLKDLQKEISQVEDKLLQCQSSKTLELKQVYNTNSDALKHA